MSKIIPQQIAQFVPPRTLEPYTVKKVYFENSPVKIKALEDGRFFVHKVSTGCVAVASSWNEAVGIRRATIERYMAIENLLR